MASLTTFVGAEWQGVWRRGQRQPSISLRARTLRGYHRVGLDVEWALCGQIRCVVSYLRGATWWSAVFGAWAGQWLASVRACYLAAWPALHESHNSAALWTASLHAACEMDCCWTRCVAWCNAGSVNRGGLAHIKSDSSLLAGTLQSLAGRLAAHCVGAREVHKYRSVYFVLNALWGLQCRLALGRLNADILRRHPRCVRGTNEARDELLGSQRPHCSSCLLVQAPRVFVQDLAVLSWRLHLQTHFYIIRVHLISLIGVPTGLLGLCNSAKEASKQYSVFPQVKQHSLCTVRLGRRVEPCLTPALCSSALPGVVHTSAPARP